MGNFGEFEALRYSVEKEPARRSISASLFPGALRIGACLWKVHR